jgi:hypothetical protein
MTRRWKVPRPKFKPTEEQRLLVKHLASVGTPHDQIARKLGVRSPKTIRKYFRDEIDLGAIEANANVAGSTYKKAMSGNVEAQKFWLMCRAGWGRATFQPAAAPPPFVVARNDDQEAA